MLTSLLTPPPSPPATQDYTTHRVSGSIEGHIKKWRLCNIEPPNMSFLVTRGGEKEVGV